MSQAQSFLAAHRTQEGSLRIAPFASEAVAADFDLQYRWIFNDGSELVLSSGVAYAI